MKRSKVSRALFGSAMALAVASSAARPMVSEPRDDVTFSMRVGIAVPGLTVSSPRLDLSATAATNGGDLLFGGKASPTKGTSPFDATSFGNGDDVFVAWSPNPRADSNHHAHGHELVEPVGTLTPEGSGGQGISPVTAVPESSTYVLLALGLAGIASRRAAAGALKATYCRATGIRHRA